MQPPEQRQRDGGGRLSLTTASGFQWVTLGTGSMGAPSLSRSQLNSSTPAHTNSSMEITSRLKPGACWVTGWSGKPRSSTWEVFADDLRRLGGPGHAGVDQDVVLEAQRRQPLTRQLGLLAT